MGAPCSFSPLGCVPACSWGVGEKGLLGDGEKWECCPCLGAGVEDRKGRFAAQSSPSPVRFPRMPQGFLPWFILFLLRYPLMREAFLDHPPHLSLSPYSALFLFFTFVSTGHIHLFVQLSFLLSRVLHDYRDFVLFTAGIKSQLCQLLANLTLVEWLISLCLFIGHLDNWMH